MAEQSPINGVGTVVDKEGLGVYIQPDNDDHAVVGFNLQPLDQVPAGLKLGDRVNFTVKDPRDTNATSWSKIEKPSATKP